MANRSIFLFLAAVIACSATPAAAQTDGGAAGDENFGAGMTFEDGLGITPQYLGPDGEPLQPGKPAQTPGDSGETIPEPLDLQDDDVDRDFGEVEIETDFDNAEIGTGEAEPTFDMGGPADVEPPPDDLPDTADDSAFDEDPESTGETSVAPPDLIPPPDADDLPPTPVDDTADQTTFDEDPETGGESGAQPESAEDEEYRLGADQPSDAGTDLSVDYLGPDGEPLDIGPAEDRPDSGADPASSDGQDGASAADAPTEPQTEAQSPDAPSDDAASTAAGAPGDPDDASQQTDETADDAATGGDADVAEGEQQDAPAEGPPADGPTSPPGDPLPPTGPIPPPVAGGGDVGSGQCMTAPLQLVCANMAPDALAQCIGAIETYRSTCSQAFASGYSCQANCLRVAAELRMSEGVVQAARTTVETNYSVMTTAVGTYPSPDSAQATLSAWREAANAFWAPGSAALPPAYTCLGPAIDTYETQCIAACDSNGRSGAPASCRSIALVYAAIPPGAVHLVPPGSVGILTQAGPSGPAMTSTPATPSPPIGGAVVAPGSPLANIPPAARDLLPPEALEALSTVPTVVPPLSTAAPVPLAAPSIKDLREEGIDQIESLESDEWTDANVDEPGMNLFDLLCIGLGDLGFSANLCIQDLLADAPGSPQGETSQTPEPAPTPQPAKP